jgi:hypothetical protein
MTTTPFALLLLDVPSGTEIGVDLFEFRAGEGFYGVFLSISGPHALYWSAASSFDQRTGGRNRAMELIAVDGVHVRRWCPATEALGRLNDSDEEHRYQMAVTRGDSRLVAGMAMARGDEKKWARLVNHLGRGAGPLPEPVPKHYIPPTARTPEEVTRHSMDRSALLAHLAQHRHAGELQAVLGDLQACFVHFLLGESEEAMNLWLGLVDLLCSCEAVYRQNEPLHAAMAEALGHQLAALPRDEFADSGLRERIVGHYRTFGPGSRPARDLARRAKLIWPEWAFDEDEDENSEDAPVMVSTELID